MNLYGSFLVTFMFFSLNMVQRICIAIFYCGVDCLPKSGNIVTYCTGWVGGVRTVLYVENKAPVSCNMVHTKWFNAGTLLQLGF